MIYIFSNHKSEERKIQIMIYFYALKQEPQASRRCADINIQGLWGSGGCFRNEETDGNIALRECC